MFATILKGPDSELKFDTYTLAQKEYLWHALSIVQNGDSVTADEILNGEIFGF